MRKLMTTAAVAAFAAASFAGPASAATLVIDLDNVQSVGFEGDAANVLRTFAIGANSRITGLAYDLTLTAFAPSWLSEMVVSLLNSDFEGVYLTPGFNRSVSGTESFAGAFQLRDLGLDFSVGADGLLSLEFFEDFDDSSVTPDGLWNGKLTVTYEPTAIPGIPEPASWGLMIAGFGLVGFAARHRQGIAAAN